MYISVDKEKETRVGHRYNIFALGNNEKFAKIESADFIAESKILEPFLLSAKFYLISNIDQSEFDNIEPISKLNLLSNQD